MTTTWGSANAEDLFRIAVRIGRFDSSELMLAIHARQRDKSRKVNVSTVEAALQIVYDRHRE